REPAASPESASAAVTVPTVTSLWSGGQSEQPAGIPEITGRVLSILTVSDWGDSMFPATSVAKKVMVVAPSLTRFIDAVFPETTCGAAGCAPVREYSVCFTIPPGLSCALRVTFTSPLFQPFTFGGGVACAVVVGAVRSRTTNTAKPLALARPFGLSDDELTNVPTPVTGSAIAKLVEPP